MLFLLSCTGNNGDKPTESSDLPTPEQIIATAADGERVTFEGQVFALTFDSEVTTEVDDPDNPDGAGYARIGNERWLLTRTEIPDGITGFAADNALGAWGLGVHVGLGISQPQVGSTVRVSGEFSNEVWNGETRPIIEDAYVELLDGPTRLSDGETCAVDADCDDWLVCARETATCAEPPPEDSRWSGPWHGVVGACDTDADCPLTQTCDANYSIPTTGEYAPGYYADRDGGKHLCVPMEGASMDALCGAMASTADLVGGRYAEGKEMCVTGTVLLNVSAQDGDTHEQLVVPEPLPYPLADAPYGVFGATTENVPPYKDPSRPQGALLDPPSQANVVALGTVHYDTGHGWYEIHPVKQYWTLP